MYHSKNNHLLQLSWFTIATGAIALLIHLLPWDLSSTLQLDREALSPWTLFTSHLSHWNLNHLTWDLLMFLILGTLVENISRNAWAAIFTLSPLAISTAFLLFSSDLQYYRGLSGIDMGLASFYITHQLRKAIQQQDTLNKALFSIALLTLFAKPIIEIVTEKPLFVSDLGTGIQNLPLAHVLGAFVGASVDLAITFTSKLKNRQNQKTSMQIRL